MTANVKESLRENLISTQVIDLMGGWTIHPIGRYLYFRKTEVSDIMDENGEVLLYLTDNSREGPEIEPAWNELIGFGLLCEHVTEEDIGSKALLPIMATGMHRLGQLYEDVDGVIEDNEDWAIREDVFLENYPFLYQE